MPESPGSLQGPAPSPRRKVSLSFSLFSSRSSLLGLWGWVNWPVPQRWPHFLSPPSIYAHTKHPTPSPSVTFRLCFGRFTWFRHKHDLWLLLKRFKRVTSVYTEVFITNAPIEISQYHVWCFLPLMKQKCYINSGEKAKRKKRALPFEGILAFCPEEVNMGLELQLEDILFMDAVCFPRSTDCVAQQREAGQGKVILN